MITSFRFPRVGLLALSFAEFSVEQNLSSSDGADSHSTAKGDLSDSIFMLRRELPVRDIFINLREVFLFSRKLATANSIIARKVKKKHPAKNTPMD